MFSIGIKDRLLNRIRTLYLRIRTLNLFPTVTDGIYSTRIFLLLLTIGIFILVFYTSIAVRIQTNIINYPTIEQFEELNKKYSSTLVCPCTQLSLSHSSIIHIQPIYHQVCSSDFVNFNKWFDYFNNLGVNFNVWDFRITGPALFTLLEIFCKMSNETVTNELNVFDNTQFVSAQALPRNIFDAQTFQLISQFEQQVIFNKVYSL